MDLDILIQKATTGEIADSELEYVVHIARTRAEGTYKALLTLGRAGAISHRKLVEEFLNSPEDPMLSRLALLILCGYWGLFEEYKNNLLDFLTGVAWDSADDVRLLAISLSANALRISRDERLERLLIGIFRKPSERHVLRLAAYCALGRVFGKSILELPGPMTPFDLERDVDPEIIAYIEGVEHRLSATA